MPNNLTDTIENQILDAIHGVTPLPAVTGPLKLRLLTAAGSDAAAGTEVTGGGYARQNVTVGAAAAGSASNTALIRFDDMPAVTVVAHEVWDAANTRRIWHTPLTSPVTTQAGQPLEFAVGSLTFGLD